MDPGIDEDALLVGLGHAGLEQSIAGEIEGKRQPAARADERAAAEATALTSNTSNRVDAERVDFKRFER